MRNEMEQVCEHGCNLPAVVVVDGVSLCHDCGKEMGSKIDPGKEWWLDDEWYDDTPVKDGHLEFSDSVGWWEDQYLNTENEIAEREDDNAN
jgi:hypothetical protein